ncbi:unnamed protein product [Dovyalis caffra]|uniref:Trichome birefringence-like C-terminal domain-containing protein n=1 Tax=Dovyalis caffra TaxID=77055 RepID=A0AAV1SQK1_9ROSI|nr:unnamed protein product [Dovyalis caffra]
MHLDRPPTFMRQFLHELDVLVINTRNYWNKGKFKKNRRQIYVNGKPNEDGKLARIPMPRTLQFTVLLSGLIHKFPCTLDLKFSLGLLLRVISIVENGIPGGSCDNIIPLTGGSEVLQDGSSDEDVESVIHGTRVKILDITALSKLRDEGHTSHYNTKASKGINDSLALVFA